MEKVTFAIDQKDCYLSGHGEYRIAGWAFDEKLQACDLYVTDENGERIPSETEPSVRIDVMDAMVSLPILADIGFTVAVKGLDALQEKGVKLLCLKTEQDGTEYTLNETALDEIYAVGREKSVRMDIDLVQEKNGFFTLIGWICNTGRREWVSIRDLSGKTYTFDMERLKRPDIIEHFHVADNRLCGFKLTFRERPFTDRFVMRVKNEYTSAEHTFTLPVREASWKTKLNRFIGREKEQPVSEEQLSEYEKHRQYYGEEDLAYEIRKAQNLSLTDYDIYRERHKVSKEELEAQRKHEFAYRPRISICIPLFNTPLNFLKELIDSVRAQTYSNWQLCLGDASTKPEPGQYIKRHYGRDSRIRYQVLKENAGISENTNAAVRFSDGEFIMFSDHDDVLEPNALFEIVKRLQDREVDVVYTDEDKVDTDGKYFYEPHFKPDFNLYYLRSCNYITHIFVAKRTIVDQVGLLNKECDGAQDYDYIFRCCEKANKIMHVPMILYHWRIHPASTAGNPESKMYAYESGVRALQGHYDRCGIKAKASRSKWLGRYCTELEFSESPAVSVILTEAPFSDYIHKIVREVCKVSTYKALEFLVPCSASEEESYLQMKAALVGEGLIRKEQMQILSVPNEWTTGQRVNYAAEQTDNAFLLLLDGHLRPLKENWIEKMLGYVSTFPEIGAVGARILMRQNQIWHAGMVVGLGRDHIGANLLYGEPADKFSYQGRGESTLETTAVSSRCMMIRKDIFRQVGGMDDTFTDLFCELDFCLKLREAGYKIVYNPDAELKAFGRFHADLASGMPMGPAYAEMASVFTDKWRKYLEVEDPYYNCNLSRVRTDCSVRS